MAKLPTPAETTEETFHDAIGEAFMSIAHAAAMLGDALDQARDLDRGSAIAELKIIRRDLLALTGKISAVI